eukprot:7978662-Pyramimonas_sp.AAC.1
MGVWGSPPPVGWSTTLLMAVEGPGGGRCGAAEAWNIDSHLWWDLAPAVRARAQGSRSTARAPVGMEPCLRFVQGMGATRPTRVRTNRPDQTRRKVRGSRRSSTFPGV